MPGNPVNLTVHKNTRDKRRARDNAEKLLWCAKAERKAGDLSGFALVTWNKDKGAACYLHMPPGNPLSVNEVDSFVAGKIRREIARLDIFEND